MRKVKGFSKGGCLKMRTRGEGFKKTENAKQIKDMQGHVKIDKGIQD